MHLYQVELLKIDVCTVVIICGLNISMFLYLYQV